MEPGLLGPDRSAIAHFSCWSDNCGLRLGAMPTMTDAELLTRLCNRDPDALMALYDRYGRCLFSLASCILRNEPARETAAEDVVATVFREAWVDAAEISRDGASVRAWLTCHVRRLALARRTPAASRPRDTGAGHSRGAMSDALSPVPSVARPDQGEGTAVWLAYFEGLSAREIGLRLHMDPDATSRALADGMRALVSPSASTPA